jgi:hypothetical protein
MRRAPRPSVMRLLVATLLTAIALAGCSADQPARAPRGPEPGTSAPGGPAHVTSVRLVVTGGIAGVHEVYRVTRSDAPQGMSTTEADRVLALAARLAATSQGESVGMAGACCDRLQYDVTVRHADGSRDHVRFGGAKTPPDPLLRIARLLAS